jgi:hypothetical protein
MKLQFFSPFLLFGFEVIETIQKLGYFIAVCTGANAMKSQKRIVVFNQKVFGLTAQTFRNYQK